MQLVALYRKHQSIPVQMALSSLMVLLITQSIDNFLQASIYIIIIAINVANELNNNSVGQIADNTDNIVADTVNLLNTENGANSATYNGEG